MSIEFDLAGASERERVREAERRSGVIGLEYYYEHLLCFSADVLFDFNDLVEDALRQDDFSIFTKPPWSHAIAYIHEKADKTDQRKNK